MSEKGLREQVVKNIINRRSLDEQLSSKTRSANPGTLSGGTKAGGGSNTFVGSIAGLESDDAFSIAPAVLNQMIRQQMPRMQQRHPMLSKARQKSLSKINPDPQTPQEVQAGVLEILKWLSDLLNPNQETTPDPTQGY